VPAFHIITAFGEAIYIWCEPPADRPPAAPFPLLLDERCYRANHVLNGIAARVLVVHFN